MGFFFSGETFQKRLFIHVSRRLTTNAVVSRFALLQVDEHVFLPFQHFYEVLLDSEKVGNFVIDDRR